MCTFGVVGLSCETPVPKPPGLHSHNNPRAQTCTFQGPGLQKHHQHSTRRHPETQKKNEMGAEEGKKRNFGRSGGEEGLAQGGPGESKPTTTTTSPTQPGERGGEEGPRRGGGPKGRASSARVGVWVCRGRAFWVQKIWPKHLETLKLAKVGLAKVGHGPGLSQGGHCWTLEDVERENGSKTARCTAA